MGKTGLPNPDNIIHAHNFQKIHECLSDASGMAMLTVAKYIGDRSHSHPDD